MFWEDPTLTLCFDAIKKPNKAREAKEDRDICFVLRERKLCRISPEEEKLGVPDTLRPKVLYLDHNVPWSGHLGREKTEKRILHRFYWPGFYKNIVKYCKSCPECQLFAHSKRGLKYLLISLIL